MTKKKLFIPKTKAEFLRFIKKSTVKELLNSGLSIWCKYDKDDSETKYLKPNKIHFLFPKEWYNLIPENYKVVDIFGKKETFKKGISNDDQRFGCLSYGFIK